MISIDDTAGPSWQFTCATTPGVGNQTDGVMVRRIAIVGGAVTIVDSETVLPSDPRLTCTPDRLTLANYAADSLGAGSLGANEYLVFNYWGDALVPGGVGLVDYQNTAELTIDNSTMSVGRDLQSAYAGGWANGDAITIIKRDEAGNDAEDAQPRVDLTDTNGATTLVFTVVNNGSNELRDVVVFDSVDYGGSLANLRCDFPTAGTSATTWDGPFAPRTSFECTAELSGVTGVHRDTATVIATGNAGVTATDVYNAIIRPAGTTGMGGEGPEGDLPATGGILPVGVIAVGSALLGVGLFVLCGVFWRTRKLG